METSRTTRAKSVRLSTSLSQRSRRVEHRVAELVLRRVRQGLPRRGVGLVDAEPLVEADRMGANGVLLAEALDAPLVGRIGRTALRQSAGTGHSVLATCIGQASSRPSRCSSPAPTASPT